ncbi:hypothetical protein PRUPE_8G072300 [Prunus persica]|uniref:Uncharacterized protein n=2 Tax=Prunus TaxID=3754 RepID=A0A251MUI2_PRUPE|nr:hypothetical protein PRUPE_8G072300 [Prunus persica]
MNPASLVKEKIMFFIKKLCKSHSKKHGVVPKGYIPVYVGKGKERKRYCLPLKYISHPTVQELIEKSQADVFDPKIEGPFVLTCNTNTFDQLLKIFKEY